GLGYGISFDILNAADYGVPQQRKRFIMMGLLSAKPSFPLPTHSKGFEEWKKFSLSLKGNPSYIPAPWHTVGKALKAIERKTLKRHDCVGMNHSEEMKQRMRLIK